MITEIKCDCSEVCGWTKPHTLEQQGKWWVCSNCATEMWKSDEQEHFISFECSTHGEVAWIK